MKKSDLIFIFLIIVTAGIILYFLLKKYKPTLMPKIAEIGAGAGGGAGGAGRGAGGEKKQLTPEEQAKLLAQVRESETVDSFRNILSVAEDYLTSGAYGKEYLAQLVGAYNERAERLNIPRLTIEEVVELAQAHIESRVPWTKIDQAKSVEEIKKIITTERAKVEQPAKIEGKVTTPEKKVAEGYTASTWNDPIIQKAIAEGKNVVIGGVEYTPEEARANLQARQGYYKGEELRGFVESERKLIKAGTEGEVKTTNKLEGKATTGEQAYYTTPEEAVAGRVEKKLEREEKKEREAYGEGGREREAYGGGGRETAKMT
jgi:hypothetical protein